MSIELPVEDQHRYCTDLDETFDAYSPFVTKYDNMSYDSVMPAASKIKGQTSRKVDEREPKETELANAGFTDEAYKNYVDWELEVRNPDVPLVKMLFERAVANNRQSVMLWEAYIDFYVSQLRHPVLMAWH